MAPIPTPGVTAKHSTGPSATTNWVRKRTLNRTLTKSGPTRHIAKPERQRTFLIENLNFIGCFDDSIGKTLPAHPDTIPPSYHMFANGNYVSLKIEKQIRGLFDNITKRLC